LRPALERAWGRRATTTSLRCRSWRRTRTEAEALGEKPRRCHGDIREGKLRQLLLLCGYAGSWRLRRVCACTLRQVQKLIRQLKPLDTSYCKRTWEDGHISYQVKFTFSNVQQAKLARDCILNEPKGGDCPPSL
jgi:hypothetical protein